MRLGFGVGVVDVGTQGGVADAADGAISAAALFLAAYGPHGMVLNFDDDASISINDAADLLDFESSGQVSGGALVGPGAKLTNTAPSVKLTEQADGNLGFQAHNMVLQSEDFSNASWSKSAGTTVTGTNVVSDTNAAALTNINQTVTVVSGATYAVTWRILKDATPSATRAVAVQVSSGGAFDAWLDTSTGVVRNIPTRLFTSVTSESDGTHWKVTGTLTAGASTLQVAIYPSAGAIADVTTATTASYSGTPTGSVTMGYVHVRRTPSVSTYVATTSAAVFDLPYVFSAGARQGIQVEPAATNLCVRSSDLTSASWTASNMTAAMTATGPDNVANSATTLTATAGNATILQAITSASSARNTSVYIRRRTGSGNIDLTQDNGTTWTTQTVTSSWTRVALPSVTSTNPTVGIRIVTSGDEVDVYCFQLETGTVATSPIITYGATVLRAADTPNALLSLFPAIGTAYTIYAKYKPQSASVATTAIRLDDTTANELVSLGNNASGQGLATVTDGGTAQAAITSGTITASAFHRVAASVEANNVRFVVNGGAEVQDTSVTLPTLTRLLLTAGGGMELVQLAILPGARTEAQLQALGA